MATTGQEEIEKSVINIIWRIEMKQIVFLLTMILLTANVFANDPNDFSNADDPNALPTKNDPVMIIVQQEINVVTIKMYIIGDDPWHVINSPYFRPSVITSWYDFVRVQWPEELRDFYIKGKSLDELKDKLK